MPEQDNYDDEVIYYYTFLLYRIKKVLEIFA